VTVLVVKCLEHKQRKQAVGSVLQVFNIAEARGTFIVVCHSYKRLFNKHLLSEVSDQLMKSYAMIVNTPLMLVVGCDCNTDSTGTPAGG